MKIALDSRGIESTSYFQGAATIDYAHLGEVIALVVGVGQSEYESADDAIEQLAQVVDLPQGLLDNTEAYIKTLDGTMTCAGCDAEGEEYDCEGQCELYYHTVAVLYEETDM